MPIPLKTFINLVFILLFSIVGKAQDLAYVHKTALPVLLINTDAVSGGLADNGVATAPDVFGVYHNPSKMVFLSKGTDIATSFTPWLRGVSDDVFIGELTYANKYSNNAVFGASVKYFSFGKVDLTDSAGLKYGEGKPIDFIVTGVYGMKLSKAFSMGVSMKYIHSNLKLPSEATDVKAVNSVAADVSGFYKTNKFSYSRFDAVYRSGFNLSNLGPKVTYRTGVKSFIPLNLKIGGGMDVVFDKENSLGIGLETSKLLVSSKEDKAGWFKGISNTFSDSNFSQELKELVYGLSLSYSYREMVTLRSGYHNESIHSGSRNFITTGLGFSRANYNLDFSYLFNTSDVPSALSNSMRFSIGYHFKKRKRVKKKEEAVILPKEDEDSTKDPTKE